MILLVCPIEAGQFKTSGPVDKTADEPVDPPKIVIQKCGEQFCVDRMTVDVMNSICESEKRCRERLTDCRKIPKTGWEPSTVVLVVGGIVLSAVAASFAAGYAVGK